MKNNIRNLIANLSLLFSDQILHQNIAKYLDFLQKSQWWSESDLKEFQNEKLRSLIKHSYENVPYYHDLFKERKLSPQDIKTTDDLVKLPILEKKTIRENFRNGRIIAKNIPKKDLILSASSGSTGEPLQYYITKSAYSFNLAANLRGWYWMGFRLGDKYIKLSQNPRNSFVKKIQDKLSGNKYLFSQQLTEENFSRIIYEIKKYKPKILRGYPDPLYFLARYAEKNNINNLKIPIITTTGNILFPEIRNFIENQFNSKIYDSYSCEGSTNFFESPEGSFYYGTNEYAITEIISYDKEVKFGERGRHISTDLHNYATPFIRYDTQDYLTKVNNEIQKNKKKNLITITRIDGRDNDILITPSGKFLIVHNFTVFFQGPKLNSVEQFQVIQNKINAITINLVVNNNFNKLINNYVIEYWQNYIGNNVKININIVNEILPSLSGKRRFIIRDKSIPISF